jgi:hypothetical protein
MPQRLQQQLCSWALVFALGAEPLCAYLNVKPWYSRGSSAAPPAGSNFKKVWVGACAPLCDVARRMSTKQTASGLGPDPSLNTSTANTTSILASSLLGPKRSAHDLIAARSFVYKSMVWAGVVRAQRRPQRCAYFTLPGKQSSGRDGVLGQERTRDLKSLHCFLCTLPRCARDPNH